MIETRHKKIGIVILAVTMAGLIYYIVRNWADFQRLTLARPIYIIPLIILLILDYFVIGLITRALVQPLGLEIGILEALLISTMTGFYNMILPFRGGMATRAVYLKTRHDFSYTNFLATLSAGYILIYLIASFLGIISLLYTYTSKGVLSILLLLAFLGIFVTLLFIILFSPQVHETKHEWLNKFIRVINGWSLIKKNKRLIMTTLFLSLCQMLVETASLYLQFHFFGIEVSFVKCIFLSAVASLGLLIQITPSGIGINEALIAFSAQVISVTPAETLAATLLGRAIGFVFLIVFGTLSSYLLVKEIAKNKE